MLTPVPGSVRRVTWRAPGRVNLIGEHTDYNDGFVLPFAIRQSVLVTASTRDDGMLAVASGEAGAGEGGAGEGGAGEVLVPLDGLRPGAVSGWAAYPAGVLWALSQAGYEVGAASLAIESDLPAGAGLSSSAALECAVAACLADLAGVSLPRRELARLARQAENDFVGVPCGIMDQSAVMLCEAGHALLLDCRSGETQPVPLDPAAFGLRLLVIDTRVRHHLGSGEYAERRRSCERAAAMLGVPALRDVDDPGALAGLGDPVLMRRARHVVTENARVMACVELLRGGRLAECGPLLTESHRSLRDDFEVSWPKADLAVDASLAAGALGARMVGGGFGGCVLALLPETAARSVVAAISAAVPGAGCYEAVPAAGATRVG